VEDGKKADADDDRPPICPACGVTMGMTIDEDGSTRYVCLECGFSDEPFTAHRRRDVGDGER
jgi:hypothetical protein